MTDPDFADATYVEPLDVDVLAAIIERERPDAVLPTLGGQTALNLAMELVERTACSACRARRADRRQRRGHRHRRGPRAVQGGDEGDRPRRPAVGHRAHDRRGAGGRRAHRAARGDPARVHPRRQGHRHRLDARASSSSIAGRRARRQPDLRDPHRAVDRRVEGVRARGHARPRRQLRGHLLDREPRPDGRPHRRLDHGRSGPDALRRRVPGDARRRVRVHPARRRRDRRVERAVRPRSRPTATWSSSR